MILAKAGLALFWAGRKGIDNDVSLTVIRASLERSIKKDLESIITQLDESDNK